MDRFWDLFTIFLIYHVFSACAQSPQKISAPQEAEMDLRKQNNNKFENHKEEQQFKYNNNRLINQATDQFKRATIHPFYNPFIEYRNSYIRETLLNNANAHSNQETVYDTGYLKSLQTNARNRDGLSDTFSSKPRAFTTIDQGNYKEYVHSDPPLRPNHYHNPAPEQPSVNDGKFKNMKMTSSAKHQNIDPGNAEQTQRKNDNYGRPDEYYHDACNFMEKMHLRHYIGTYGFDMICGMYKQWGNGMKTESKWKPTEGQRSWFDSLGSRARSNQRRSHYRSKRQTRGTKALRKEYRVLTDRERYRLHRALNILKRTFMDGISMYDVIVQNHAANVAPGAHFGPAFLGYHRELLIRFENALKEIDPSVSVPYWDSNLDHVLGDELAQRSILWSPSFLGNGVGDVTEGPFAYWRLEFPSRTSDTGFLHRNLTVAPDFARTMPALMSDQAILDFFEAKNLRNISWFVNPVYESHHGAVHNWVGGVMADIPISPSDPVFFMHHAFLDCLWEQMRYEQKRHNVNFDPQYDYPNDSIALGVGMEQPDGTILRNADESYHHALSPMLPFTPLLNIDGLSNIYVDEFYSCQPSPLCSPSQLSCESPYLFCDISKYLCAPKLQINAPCKEFENSSPCLDGKCCDGVCQITCETQYLNSRRFDLDTSRSRNEIYIDRNQILPSQDTSKENNSEQNLLEQRGHTSNQTIISFSDRQPAHRIGLGRRGHYIERDRNDRNGRLSVNTHYKP